MKDTSDDSPYDLVPQDTPRAARESPPARPAEPPRSEPGPRPEQERICPHCGYQYSGKLKARCPDCAAPAEMATDLLQFAHAGWVRRVSAGVLLLPLGIGLHVAGSVLSYLGFSKGLHGGAGNIWQGTMAHLAASVTLALCVYLVTWQEKARPGKRAGAITAHLMAWLALGCWIARAIMLHRGNGDEQSIKTIVILATLAQGVLAMALAYQLKALAVRVPSDQLASHSVNSGASVLVVCLTLVAIRLLDLYWYEFFRFFMCSFPLIAGLLVILAWAMVTALRLSFDMRASASAGQMIEERRRERQMTNDAKKRAVGRAEQGQNPADLKE